MVSGEIILFHVITPIPWIRICCPRYGLWGLGILGAVVSILKDHPTFYVEIVARFGKYLYLLSSALISNVGDFIFY